jgi:dihydrofolate synthase/folylpolyglutamate synthase
MNAKMNPKNQFINHLKKMSNTGFGADLNPSIDLHRTGLLIKQLITPDYLSNADTIVITGTDGKGSTGAITNAILQRCGLTTGLFTSPHFLEFNERFKINAKAVDYPELLEAMQTLNEAKSQLENQLNEQYYLFETLFVLALMVFERHQVPTLIFEAGIGGRYDPVRLLKAKLTALTSIALEHTNLLGNTTELIAFDKLDACAPGGTTVIGHIEAALKPKIIDFAALKDGKIIDSAHLTTLKAAPNSKAGNLILTLKDHPPVTINSSLIGEFQHYNIQTAVALCHAFLQHSPDRLPTNFTDLCRQGIESCAIPGRFEKIADAPELYIDSAHTAQAYTLLFNTIQNRFNDKPVIFVAGLSKGRDNHAFASKLLSLGDEIIITQASYRAADPQQLLNSLKTQAPEAQNLHLEADLAQAIALAKSKAQAIDGRLFVVGGLFLAAEVSALEKGIDLPVFLPIQSTPAS